MKFENLYNQVSLETGYDGQAHGRIISEKNVVYFDYDFETATATVEVVGKNCPNIEAFIKRAVSDWAEAEADEARYYASLPETEYRRRGERTFAREMQWHRI